MSACGLLNMAKLCVWLLFHVALSTFMLYRRERSWQEWQTSPL
uniref:Uncharacterized protein n=1 Tax=Arundo donax TaxID=35708 RepID=A0A0A9CLA3_ARUDO